VGCLAGALSGAEYPVGLAAAGFEQVSVVYTHQVGDGLHSAIIKAIKAIKPTDASAATTATAPAGRTTLPMASDSSCCSQPPVLRPRPGGTEPRAGMSVQETLMTSGSW